MNKQLNDIFTLIYEKNLWGSHESKSGIGSTLEYTNNIRKALIKIISEQNIKTILDTSCGDWNWMKLIKDNLPKYIGIDIVEEIIKKNISKFSNDNISFVNDDFLNYISNLENNSIDLILCRHTLEHLPTEYNIKFLQECNRVSKYLLLTTHDIIKKNIDLIYPNTYRPINIKLDPYSFIMPYLKDRIYDGPSSIILPEMFILFFDFTKRENT